MDMCRAVTSLETKALWDSDHEEGLIRRCQAGDWADYGELVTRYQRLAWAAIDAVVDDKASIPDLVQEVFIRVYEKLHTFTFQARFSSWLFRISRNIGLNFNRTRSRRPRYDSLEHKVETGGTISAGDQMDNPEAHYAAATKMEVVERLLRRLPEKYRVVVNLYYVQEYSYSDMASALGLPLNTVRTRLKRGRERLLELSRQAGWV